MVARRLSLLAAALALAAGCAGMSARRQFLPPPAGDSRVGTVPSRADPAIAPASPAELEQRDAARAVEAAAALVGKRKIVVGGVDYGPDCAALVRAAFDRAGHPLPASVRDASGLHALAASRGVLRPPARAVPGDVIFLADRPGGPPTHVGLVARIDGDGTAVAFHRVARGVMRLRLNVGQPSRLTDPATGRRLNDALVVGGTTVPAGDLVVDVAGLL
jgi:hypothetical protein